MPHDLKLLRILVGLLSAAVALSAIALAAGAIFAGDKPKWPLFGMEIVALVSGVLGLLLALGKMRGAPALALAAVAGSIFVAAVLGYYGASGRLDLKGDKPAILLKPLLLARLASVALIACVAAHANLRRDPIAAKTFWKGVLWALPLVLMGGASIALRSTLAGLGEGLMLALAAVAAIVAMVSLSGAGHCFIRAFEIGGKKDDAPAANAGA